MDDHPVTGQLSSLLPTMLGGPTHPENRWRQHREGTQQGVFSFSYKEQDGGPRRSAVLPI